MNKFRVFKFDMDGETEYVIAKTFIHAIKVHSSICGWELYDYNDTDEITEIPESEWDTQKVTYSETNEEKTFRQIVNQADEEARIFSSTLFN